MSKIPTRIAKIKDHKDIILGRDLEQVFENGHVYEAIKYGEYIWLKDLGEHALTSKNEGQPLQVHIRNGLHCLTKEEFEQQHKSIKS